MLADYLEPFLRLEVDARPDGLGGTVETRREGEPFRGGITHEPGAEIAVAGQRQLRLRTLLVHETSVGFRQGELVKRIADGAVFRIAGADVFTPERAAIRLGQAEVELL